MILTMNNINKSYNNEYILDDLSLSVNHREIVCILGPSGCGKTTLLNIISGSINADSGYINNLSKKTSYVFQEDRLLPWKTVYENIRLVNKNKSQNEINELIKKVELNGNENKYPHELSGGMKQRCSIARAFNYDCELLLMDEPFKSLDIGLRKKMINNLLNLCRHSNSAVIFVTHDVDEALLLGDVIVVLSKKPTKILMKIKIDIDAKNRSLDNKDLLRMKENIENNLRGN